MALRATTTTLQCNLVLRRHNCNGPLVADVEAAMERPSPAAELQWSARHLRRSCNGALIVGSRPRAPMQHSRDGSRCCIAMLAGGSMQRRGWLLGELGAAATLGVDALATTGDDAMLQQVGLLPKGAAMARRLL